MILFDTRTPEPGQAAATWLFEPIPITVSSSYVFPFPPCSGNHQHGRICGKTYLLDKVKRWRAEVSAIVMASGQEMITGTCAVHCKVYSPTNARRDLDNIGKVLGDALQEAGAILNDGDIDDLHFRRMEKDADCPRLEIWVGRIDTEWKAKPRRKT